MLFMTLQISENRIVKKTENLGKVRDLSGNVINGYSIHNAIAIVPNDKTVHSIPQFLNVCSS